MIPKKNNSPFILLDVLVIGVLLFSSFASYMRLVNGCHGINTQYRDVILGSFTFGYALYGIVLALKGKSIAEKGLKSIEESVSKKFATYTKQEAYVWLFGILLVVVLFELFTLTNFSCKITKFIP